MSGRIIAAALLLAAAPAASQTARPTLDYANAAKIRDTCITWAVMNKLKIAIVVLEPHGMQVTSAHMDGVSVAGGELAKWKANSAAHFGRATGDFAATSPPAETPNVARMMGGVPIYTAEGVLLGGVGVSGASASEDAACATAGIEAAGLKAAKPAAPAQ